MSKNDDSLIIEMIAQAALEGDTERALYLHDNWIVEFSEVEKAELKKFFGDEYETFFEFEEVPLQ